MVGACFAFDDKKDGIEPGIAAVIWAADMFSPLRWTTLGQRLCITSTFMLLVSIRYAVVLSNTWRATAAVLYVNRYSWC